MPDHPFQPDDPRSLARALANELTEEEAAIFRRWLAHDPSRRQEFEQLRRAWTDAGRLRHRWDAEGALARLKHRARVDATTTRPSPARPLLHLGGGARRATARRVVWAAAASAAAVTIGVLALGRRATAPPPATVAATREVRTHIGETAELRFPDGTEVRLAPESHLRYPADMLGASRDLDLEGEAYVVAGKLGHAPLVIHTAAGTTRDVGTRFLVRARSADAMDVVVVDGLVVVRATERRSAGAVRSDSAVVRPGMLGRITATGRVAPPRRVHVEAYVAWLDGRLAFEDAPLAEVFATLARWRSIHYRIDDPRVARRRFTGTFDEDDGLGDIATLVATAANVSIDARGDTLTVRDDPTRRVAPGVAR
ncbi:MAG TPA: FecR domain-containing protein [Gemmatimonadaceae bacterium]